MLFTCFLYTIRAGETRGKNWCAVNERNYPAGVTNCNMACTGTDGLGYGAGSQLESLSLCWGREEELDEVWQYICQNDWKALPACSSQRFYNAEYPVLYDEGLSYAPVEKLLRNIYFSYTWLVERTAKADWCCPAWGQVRPGCRNFLVTGEVLCCRMWIFFMATRFLSSWVCFLVTGSSILMTRKRCYLIINWLIGILYHKWLCLFWSLSYSWVSCRWWDKIELLEPGITIISHLETLPPNHQCLTSSAVSSVQEN